MKDAWYKLFMGFYALMMLVGLNLESQIHVTFFGFALISSILLWGWK